MVVMGELYPSLEDGRSGRQFVWASGEAVISVERRVRLNAAPVGLCGATALSHWSSLPFCCGVLLVMQVDCRGRTGAAWTAQNRHLRGFLLFWHEEGPERVQRADLPRLRAGTMVGCMGSG